MISDMVVVWRLCWAAGAVVVGPVGVGVWGRWGPLLHLGLLEMCLGVIVDSEAERVVFGILMWWSMMQGFVVSKGLAAPGARRVSRMVMELL